jgi:hypothetical protein
VTRAAIAQKNLKWVEGAYTLLVRAQAYMMGEIQAWNVRRELMALNFRDPSEVLCGENRIGIAFMDAL